jgi:hypothetical protein
MNTIDWNEFPQKDLAAQHAVLVLLISRLQANWPAFTSDCCPEAMLRSRMAEIAHKLAIEKLPVAARQHMPRPERVPCKPDCIYCQCNRAHLYNLDDVYRHIKSASAACFDPMLSVKVTVGEYQQRENTKRGKDTDAAIDTYYADQLLFVRSHIDTLPAWCVLYNIC